MMNSHHKIYSILSLLICQPCNVNDVNVSSSAELPKSDDLT